MVANGDRRSIIKIPEQFNRRPYVLNKTNPRGEETLSVLYNGTQSYYTFRHSCEIDRRVRRVSAIFHILEIDNRPLAIVHSFEISRTGNINVTIVENSSDPYFNTTIYLVPKINMKRVMFTIFAIEQNKKHLVAQVNSMPSGSSRLPIPDAYTFAVDISEETNDKEIELARILSSMIDEMQDYTTNEDDGKEDFYNSDLYTES